MPKVIFKSSAAYIQSSIFAFFKALHGNIIYAFFNLFKINFKDFKNIASDVLGGDAALKNCRPSSPIRGISDSLRYSAD